MDSSTPIRWGIMGTGRVAQQFMADLSTVDGAIGAAVGSRTAERAQIVAKRFGIQRAHDSYEELVRDPEIDVVYVATEHHQHAEHCLLALHEGKHVLCEKPFATSVAAASSVIESAKQHNLFCMEAMWTRFIPAVVESKRRIDAGEIGIPMILSADFGSPVVDSGSSRFFDPKRGGGALLDRGVYAISLAVWLFGKPEHVSGRGHLLESGVDQTTAAILGFHDNRIAVIAASLGAYSSNEAVVAGSLGRLHLHEPLCRPERVSINRAHTMEGDAQYDLLPKAPKERVRRFLSRARAYLPVDSLRATVLRYPVKGYGYSYEAAEVVRCLREGLKESPIMPLRDTLTIAETVQRIQDVIIADSRRPKS